MALLKEIDTLQPLIKALRKRCEVLGDRLWALESRETPEVENSTLNALRNARDLVNLTQDERTVELLMKFAFRTIPFYEYKHSLLDNLLKVHFLRHVNSNVLHIPHCTETVLASLPALPSIQHVFVAFFEAVKSGNKQAVQEAYDGCALALLDCFAVYLDIESL